MPTNRNYSDNPQYTSTKKDRKKILHMNRITNFSILNFIINNHLSCFFLPQPLLVELPLINTLYKMLIYVRIKLNYPFQNYILRKISLLFPNHQVHSVELKCLLWSYFFNHTTFVLYHITSSPTPMSNFKMSLTIRERMEQKSYLKLNHIYMIQNEGMKLSLSPLVSGT